ncbi:CAP domain-containing protein [Desulforapulum autotrophicum]|nr:CAP domain-containing protein [Desulforapulum autotrophicum]
MIKYIFTTLMALLVGFTAFADESGPEDEFYRLVNRMRENPVATAISLGVDMVRLEQEMPKVYLAMEKGMAPLAPNENLKIAAGRQTKEMAEQSRFALVFADGDGFDQLIKESGYESSMAKESLGMVTFLNFMDPWTGVRIVFEGMLKKELDPDYQGLRNLLDPDLEEIGIGFDYGSMAVSGRYFNAYLVAADFGKKDGAKETSRLMRLINQARSNPLSMAAILGLDVDELRQNFPELESVFDNGLAPLGRNVNLDSVWVNGVAVNSPGETDPAVTVGVVFEDQVMTVAEDVEQVFKNIFLAELNGSVAVERHILNPDFKEIGICMGYGILESGRPGFAAQCRFSRASDLELAYIVGFVCNGVNIDAFCDTSEGVPSLELTVEEMSNPDYWAPVYEKIRTDEAGSFQLTVRPGLYRVSVLVGDVSYEQFLNVGGGVNSMVTLFVDLQE